MIAVVGPTASGKTAVGIALAERLGGEIVSADAVAVYRGLDIGAAKPTPQERARIPFHLVDVVDPADDFTVVAFATQAESAIAAIQQRGKLPLVVGGTGLYVRAVTATLSIPPVAPQSALRQAWWDDVARSGAPALHARLAQRDPLAAATIHPGDAKRIIRALEVEAVTGVPMSAFATPEGVRGVLKPGVALYGLRWERQTLYERIERRVETMMADGLLGEVERLLLSGVPADCKAMQSLGYRHLVKYRKISGTLEESVAEIKRDTRRFAKRQISWFGNDPAVCWIDVREGESATEIADRLIKEHERIGNEQDAGASGHLSESSP